MGVAKARRGEGLGDVKGEAVEDFARVKAGGAIPKPRGGPALTPLVLRGDGAREVLARGICCQAAGSGRRMIL